jgi:SMC interacting uncharacterized protein involved in chromosome segregation
MDLFYMENGVVAWLPQTLAIKEFKAVWSKNRNKDMAFKELSYIFFMEDLRSPFRNYTEEEKEDKVIEAIFSKEWKPDERVQVAQEMYKELMQTRSMKLLRSAWHNLDDLSEFINNIDYNERDSNDKYINDISKVRSTIESLPKLVAALKKLEDEVKKEVEEGGSLRGGREKGMFEDDLGG